MFKRTITGIVFIGVLLASIIIHPGMFFILFLLLTLAGLYEFYEIAGKTGAMVQKTTGILGGLLVFVVLSSYYLFDMIELKHLSICLVLPFFIFISELFKKSATPIINIAVTLMGIIYVAVPFALLSFFIIYGNNSESEIYSPEILLGYLFLIWTSDTCAYLAGKSIGKRKLFKRISPKKTWEGVAGGLIFALILAYILSVFFKELSFYSWITVAVISVVTGILGDLTESMFKRSVGIKDSGILLPGHGGILDRFDAVLISAPFVWIYLSLIN